MPVLNWQVTNKALTSGSAVKRGLRDDGPFRQSCKETAGEKEEIKIENTHTNIKYDEEEM